MKYMNYLKQVLITIIVSIVVAGSFVGVASLLQDTPDPQLGADNVLPLAGSTYTLAGSGVSASASSITLTSFTIPQTGYDIQDSDLSDTFYITLEPGSKTRQEIASCTTVTQNADSATLSGCTRGLLPFSPYTASSSYQFAHAGGTSVILSNPPQLFNQFTSKDNDETISGTWIFGSSTFPQFDSNRDFTSASSTVLVDKNYVDNVATSGAANADDDTSGLIRIATSTEISIGSSTETDASGQTVFRVPDAGFFTTTSTADKVPVAESDGFLQQAWLDLSEAFTWTGNHIFNGTLTANSTTTLSSTTTISGETTINGLIYPSFDGVDGDILQTDGQGNLTLQTVNSVERLDTINSSTTQQSTTNVVDELTLATSTIPGGTLGSDNAIRVTIYISDIDDGGGDSNTRLGVKYGGTGILSDDLTSGEVSNIQGMAVFNMVGNGTTTSQHASLDTEFEHFTNGKYSSFSIDSTQDQTLEIFFKSGDGNANDDSMTFEAMTVEKIGQ